VEVSELLLRRNRISKLPDSWNFLENLKNLDLSSNRLTELPPSIGGLKNLHTLFIQHNQITSLPGTKHSSAPLLSRLWLQPRSIFFNQLIVDYFFKKSINRRGHSNADEFGKLNNLNKLLMNDNKLEYLPRT
jgi:Leucine-rich repeat (LRR) protein